VANLDIPLLAIRAQAEAIEPEKPQPTEPARPAAMKPVATVMDDQVRRHQQIETQMEFRKAAGAESQEELDFDIASLRRKRDYDLDI